MPTRDRPDPPADLDRDARAALARLEDRDADCLRDVGRYLEELAAWKESTGEDADEEDSDGEHETDPTGTDTSDDGVGHTEADPDAETADEFDDSDLEYPDGVPERATVTVKEIGGTTYYYYQWRDGDRIESKTVQRE